MAINLIYQQKPVGGSIWQGGYREIPSDLPKASIHTVIYAAEECPPLNHHLGADLKYCPNDDSMAPEGHQIYQALYDNALRGVRAVTLDFKNGKNILVLCNQGLNRSGLVIGLSLQLLTTMTSTEIIKLIQTNRPGALNNPSFIRMIESEIIKGPK